MKPHSLIARPSPLADTAQVDAAVFDSDVPLGTMQGPIKTKFGYHILKVVKRE